MLREISRHDRCRRTSAGAIAAALVAAIEKSGQPMTVLHDYMDDLDYRQFMRGGDPLQQVFEKFGGRFADAWELVFRNGAEAATRFLIRWAEVGGVPRSFAQAAAAARQPAEAPTA